MAKPVIISGAGLCGSLLALRLAQRGLQVEVYEKRSDLRKVHTEGGRSINLAFSDRGNKGMKLVGLEKKVQSICIPMKGRMLHHKNGEKQLAPYSGRPHEYINSISREGLTALILDEAEAMPNVTLHFNHSCTSVDIDHKVAHFFNEIEHKSIEVEGEVIFGTDGAGSSLRRSYESHPPYSISTSVKNFFLMDTRNLKYLPPLMEDLEPKTMRSTFGLEVNTCV